METLHLDRDQIEEAALLLKKGGVVAFPTETVYGLGALVSNEEAIKNIYKVKGRPGDNPLIAHVASISQALLCARDVPEEFYLLTKAFWPGPLSIVLKKSDLVPYIASAGLDSIAVRMPEEKIALELIEKVGSPLVAPSANKSGFPSSTTPEHVADDFEGTIDGIIWGDSCKVGIESTVISLLDRDKPLLLRSGTISKEELESVLKREVFLAPKSDKPLSPGMKYRHYSPETLLFLFDDLRAFEVACHASLNKRVAILGKKPLVQGDAFTYLGELGPNNLYLKLRELDKGEFDLAIVYSSKEELIFPRLLHATGGEVNVDFSAKEVLKV